MFLFNNNFFLSKTKKNSFFSLHVQNNVLYLLVKNCLEEKEEKEISLVKFALLFHKIFSFVPSFESGELCHA